MSIAPSLFGKRILFVNGAGDYSGASKMAHLYAKEFRQAGADVHFVVGDVVGGEVTQLLSDELDRDGFPSVSANGFYTLRPAPLIKKIAQHIQALRPDFVISSVQVDVKVVGPACRKVGANYCIFDQTEHRFFGPKLLQFLKAKAFAHEMRKAPLIVPVSDQVKRQLVEEYRCDPAKIKVVYNGIDCKKLSQKTLAAPDLQRRPLRIINVARLDEQKAQHLLIDAIAICQSQGLVCHLSLVGDASNSNEEMAKYKATLLEMVHRLGLESSVSFLGWRRDVPELMANADLYVHSSIREGFPLAPIEAMAMGLPMIMTDCAGRPEFFENNRHGLIVETGSADALAQAILAFSRLDLVKTKEIAAAGRQLVLERLDIAATAKEFISHLNAFKS